MAPREVWASAFQAKEPTNRTAAAAVKATDSFWGVIFRVPCCGDYSGVPRFSRLLSARDAISARQGLFFEIGRPSAAVMPSTHTSLIRTKTNIGVAMMIAPPTMNAVTI